MSDKQSPRVVQGLDLSPDAFADELRKLADAIDENRAYVRGVQRSESAVMDDAVTHELTVEFIPTDMYAGRLANRYDMEGDE